MENSIVNARPIMYRHVQFSRVWVLMISLYAKIGWANEICRHRSNPAASHSRPALRRVRALVVKESRQVVRDPSSVAIGVVLPVILILLFGYGLSLDVKNVPVAVVVEDTSPSATELAAGFTAVALFRGADRHVDAGGSGVALGAESRWHYPHPSGLFAAIKRGKARSASPGQRNGRKQSPHHPDLCPGRHRPVVCPARSARA